MLFGSTLIRQNSLHKTDKLSFHFRSTSAMLSNKSTSQTDSWHYYLHIISTLITTVFFTTRQQTLRLTYSIYIIYDSLFHDITADVQFTYNICISYDSIFRDTTADDTIYV